MSSISKYSKNLTRDSNKLNSLYSKNLLKKVGDISQIAGVRQIEFTSGKGRRTEAFEVYNASGIQFTVLSDMCMDIFNFTYKGINIGFISKNGLVGNKFFNALDNEFLYYWRAGMLYTCGLANTGPSCTDEGLHRTEHGRIGMLPAENISINTGWEEDNYNIKLSGEIKETLIYGYNLKFKRTISTDLISKEVHINDFVENMEPGEEEFMLLYHFNFGYPFLDKDTRLIKPDGKVVPRFNETPERVRACFQMEETKDNCEEECFYHKNRPDKDGWAYTGLINRKIGLGVFLKYGYKNLPIFMQWKSCRSHDYTMGLEPSNSYINGRSKERKSGTLSKIKGYEKIEYNLILGILDGEDEINEFENDLKNI